MAGSASPATDDPNGSYRGSRTTEIDHKIWFLTAGLFDGVAPAAQGGTTGRNLLKANKEVLATFCAIQRMLPVDASADLIQHAANVFAAATGFNANYIADQLPDTSLCADITASLRPQYVAFDVPTQIIAVDAKGNARSKNQTWNACYDAYFEGYALTKEDIRENEQVDKDGTPRDCAYYFNLAAKTAYYPDYSIYLTIDGEGNVTPPAGYVLAETTTVAAK